MEVRPFTPPDTAAVVALLASSLGWERRDDDRYAEFFSWKHHQNPFGRSVAWVAVDGEEIVGFRTFMRWEFIRDGEPVGAVRAVDTATRPDYRGRGVFTRLTTTAVEELRSAGVAFVFNTPNDKSRPGYLKMGWEVVGRVPVDVRLRAPSALLRVLRSRVPAEKWSSGGSRGGVPAADALADGMGVTTLLDQLASEAGVSAPANLSTRRSSAFLSWRYGFAPLGYRALLAGASIADGVAIFHVRQRGRSTEATICDVLVPGREPSTEARLVRQILEQSGADFAVRAGRGALGAGAMIRVPRQGPILTWRGLADTRRPPLKHWRVALGDIELF